MVRPPPSPRCAVRSRLVDSSASKHLAGSLSRGTCIPRESLHTCRTPCDPPCSTCTVASVPLGRTAREYCIPLRPRSTPSRSRAEKRALLGFPACWQVASRRRSTTCRRTVTARSVCAPPPQWVPPPPRPKLPLTKRGLRQEATRGVRRELPPRTGAAAELHGESPGEPPAPLRGLRSACLALPCWGARLARWACRERCGGR